MKFRIPGLIGDDSNRAWKWFGRHDPYYGVLSSATYRRRSLSADTLQAFFSTGQSHVEDLLNGARTHFGDYPTSSCLDFGCGVGRILIPLSQYFNKATGIDISPDMLNEARANCIARGITNVTLSQSLADSAEQYDLVHTYIVLQHIPVPEGKRLIQSLISKTSPGGLCFIHLTIGRGATWPRRLASNLRKNIRPLHFLLNMLQGRRIIEPYMQMNRYDLNALMAYLFSLDIKNLWVQTECHGDNFSARIMLRVPEKPGTPSAAKLPQASPQPVS